VLSAHIAAFREDRNEEDAPRRPPGRCWLTRPLLEESMPSFLCLPRQSVLASKQSVVTFAGGLFQVIDMDGRTV
jgi:hypothetical protein